MDTDSKKQSIELGGLSKLLFDKATIFWYGAILIEFTAGIIAVCAGFIVSSESLNIIFAIIGFLLFSFSYFLKIRFGIIYDNAETMRRQSVLAGALGWVISRTQFGEWRRLAGEKVIEILDNIPVDPNYFASQEQQGPRRLLEMTEESAFWTRHLYCYMKKYVWILFFISITFFFFVLTFAATDLVPRSTGLKVVYAVYLILPLILAMDVLGWGIKLNQLIESLKKVEESLEELSKNSSLTESKVLPLVAEYNCQMVSGIPIPSWFFGRYHNHIDSLWKKR